MHSSDFFADTVSAHLQESKQAVRGLATQDSPETPTERELGQYCALLIVELGQAIEKLEASYDVIKSLEEELEDLRARKKQPGRHKLSNLVTFPVPVETRRESA